jgi:dolichyl-phosphate-mannose--protein O-mannosyl transferase
MFLLASATVIALPLYFGARTVLSEAKTRYGKRIGKLLAKVPDLPNPFPAHFWDATLVLAGGWFFLLAPWMVARGKYTFYYHYLPSYSFALILLAGMLCQIEKLRPRVITGLLAVSAAIVIFFVPVWGEFPITKETANQRLRFKGWQP